MDETRDNVLITGRAGTGKSTLLDYFRTVTSKKIAVLAPTGVAAVNVSGQTIHSFFRFRPDVTPDKVEKVDDPLYKRLDAVVIDEISMARADLLDCIDRFLRLNGRTSSEPFGGLQMIFIGDLYQLPPVVRGADERRIFEEHYGSEYFFDSRAFKSADFEYIELEKIYRQTDETFIGLLNGIRNKTITDEEVELLNARCIGDDRVLPEDAIYLTTTNAMAKDRNDAELSKLKGRMHTFTAEVDGDFPRESFPTDPVLKIKKGAQVMLLNNDPSGRWVNGTIGTVRSIKRDCLSVKISGIGEVEVQPFTWKNYRFFWDDRSEAVETVVAGTFTQMPVRLAWAITIHKSQGKTFDRAVIDIGRGTFAPGQLYVALSRCRALEGIFLEKRVSRAHAWIDPRVVKFVTEYQYRQANERFPLEQRIAMIKSAIENGSNLKITYLKPDDTKSKRVVKPEIVEEMEHNGVKFIGMKAHCFARGSNRIFRVDRILEIETVSTPTDR